MPNVEAFDKLSERTFVEATAVKQPMQISAVIDMEKGDGIATVIMPDGVFDLDLGVEFYKLIMQQINKEANPEPQPPLMIA